MSERNPVIIPDKPVRKRVCPKCGKADFTGYRVEGVINYVCRVEGCGNKWQGGLPRVPEDPLKPLPQTNYVPPVQQVPIYNKDGAIVDHTEIRRPVSPVQDFRRGALIPDDEDY